MAQYQLEVGVLLFAGALVSALIRFLTRPKHGAIKLTADDEHKHDPFDILTPEDLIDGHPIDEEKFWAKARLWKLALSAALAFAVAADTVALAFAAIAVDNGAPGHTLAGLVLRVLFALYTLILAVRSINYDVIGPHADALWHLSMLTFAATATLFATAILPAPLSISPSLTDLIVSSTSGPLALTWTTTVLYTIAMLLAATLPHGPDLHYDPSHIYAPATLALAASSSLVLANAAETEIDTGTGLDANRDTGKKGNVCGIATASVLSYLTFSYTTRVVMLGHVSSSLEIGDLPILPGDMRASNAYAKMKHALWLSPPPHASSHKGDKKKSGGWALGWTILRLNAIGFAALTLLAGVSAVLFYAPAFFLQKLVQYIQDDPERVDRRWGWVYVVGLFGVNAIGHIVGGQLWSIATTTLQVRMKMQLNSVLYGKTLVRKDVASSAGASDKDKGEDSKDKSKSKAKPDDGTDNNDKEEPEFSSKAQIMTLMTTDVDRVAEFAWHVFAVIDSPVEIVVGTIFLSRLLGSSSLYGLLVTLLFLPLNHIAGKIVVRCQEGLMKRRDERVGLMNEVLGGIRMVKFMGWERKVEKRVLKVREEELRFQKMNFMVETLWNAIWNGSPILVTLVAFWHFTVVRGEELTPAIAFTSITIFSELKYALNALPETFINILQSLVSLRRIETYLGSAEIAPVPKEPVLDIAMQGATVTWAQDRAASSSTSSRATTPAASTSGSSTPTAGTSTPTYSTPSTPGSGKKFILSDVSVRFPPGELSLVCGKLGSGKTLLLLALLGEVDLLAGQIVAPRSLPDALANFADVKIGEGGEWVVSGMCAYVPQAAWLRNASVKDNILFNLPLDEARYQKTLEVCALVTDLEILEDGDQSEIGERGVNLSGGQKARVSLARAVYSRASTLFLDDVLSAVDAHTASHLYTACLKGELMRGRTIVLVSHHVQLCAPGASYVVALDNGRVQFAGTGAEFRASGVMDGLVQSGRADGDAEGDGDDDVEDAAEKELGGGSGSKSVGESEASDAVDAKAEQQAQKPKKAPRKLVEEEARAVGHISRDIWRTYILACGGTWFWAMFAVILVVAAMSPVAENWWLKYWAGAAQERVDDKGPAYYIAVYALITFVGLIITTSRWFVLYNGSIRASTVLYERLLESILFANIRFHDTVSRGRVLNRFGKDFEGIDSNMSDNFGRSIMYGLSAVTTFITISVIGGPGFVLCALVLGSVYYNTAKVYGQTSRDMRRLDSVTRSPLYSIYGETIAGVTVVRAFGASSKYLRDMLTCVDTNVNPYYWMWGVNRWLSIRFNLISCCIIAIAGFVAVLSPAISASLAGFALAFASTITMDILFVVRRFVGLEQSMVSSHMVAVERVKEYTELVREPPEFIEPRPAPSWPHNGAIKCEDLIIRYAPELPDVLHNLNFEIKPGEKCGILGRTGSGKSTLALSFFRFVEATEGRILVDNLDIAHIGLTDLRTKLTIIPQDPTILSGTLRSTLDVFDEYQDAEIGPTKYEALRRVHLIPSEEAPEEALDTVNANVFRNLDSPVSEGGDNFSTGEKQLLCMARAILKRSKVLVMDEATASVDYATDELISKTIRHEFADSTILTIAHRLRTVIDYDRVMILDQGRIVEFDKPATLLADSSSSFYGLCKATGKNEFSMLRKMAGL
ncbi:multidrug resistance-associated ABC transporter [Athelia psychrophila]|uniref:Multidrug resistance-associated ABC transporter n=1 Tax=Athelia psychrophila TaxID=1759441 RepID=A0A166NFG4_9AGAM|nr:multidrug resistance-associated ABC transporter [Fibularhizoctonia sp. CBS 109695]